MGKSENCTIIHHEQNEFEFKRARASTIIQIWIIHLKKGTNKKTSNIRSHFDATLFDERPKINNKRSK
jgi:hypothetical protein